MSRLRWFLRRNRARDDLAREMQAHVEEWADELIEQGLDPAAAGRQARREFGNATLQLERSDDVWIPAWLSTLVQNIGASARSLRRQPGFTIGAVAILGIAMGLVMVIVTAVNAVFLRPAFSASIVIPAPRPLPGQQFGTISGPEFRYIRDRTESLSHLVAGISGGSIARLNGAVTNVRTAYVTHGHFEALDVRPVEGRLFSARDEDYARPASVAIVSTRLAERVLGEGTEAVGQTLVVDDAAFTIVGVVPPTAHFGVDVWMPMPSINLVHEGWDFDDPQTPFASHVLARLAPGRNSAEATAELDSLSRQFRESVGQASAGFLLHGTRPIDDPGTSISRQIPVVGAIFAGTFVVLLLACANVGNLILARGMSRRHETAVRLSLGASRRRLAAEFLTEAVVLCTMAGALGVAIGYLVPRVALGLTDKVRMDPARLTPDLTVVVAVVFLVFVAAAVAGIAPAMRLARVDTAARSGGRYGVDRGAGRLRTGFLAAQVALSMTLLVAAGLLTRSAFAVLHHDPGFAIHEAQRITLWVPGADHDRQRTFMQTLDSLLDDGGMPPHALSEFRPITGAWRAAPASTRDGISRQLVMRNVSYRYFETLGIPLVAGRPPGIETGSDEVVLSQLAAQRLFPDSDPLGQTLTLKVGDGSRGYIVVGVAADVPTRSVTLVDEVVYAPFEGGTLLLVRSLSPAVVDEISAIARSIEPGVTISSAPAANDLTDSSNDIALGSYVAWSIGGVALILATIGAFGVFAYTVEERRREIGVRLALGATRTAVMRTVVGSTRWPLLAGLSSGLVLSLLASQIIRGTLYGLGPYDPVAYAGAMAILATAALVATWIPARRAARVDPAVTLRGD